ncbi:MAG: DUF2922 domain-containing protein [Dethiosulfovibrio sp.]|nr:DUF2922 domain-containing protein [Dethiosulfovibrio sp.]
MKTVKMIFGKVDGTKASLSLRYAKDDLTEAQVRSAMQAVIDNDALTAGVVSIVGAELIDRTVTDIIV